jgi:hypothetical protein
VLECSYLSPVSRRLVITLGFLVKKKSAVMRRDRKELAFGSALSASDILMVVVAHGPWGAVACIYSSWIASILHHQYTTLSSFIFYIYKHHSRSATWIVNRLALAAFFFPFAPTVRTTYTGSTWVLSSKRGCWPNLPRALLPLLIRCVHDNLQ